MGTIFHGGVRVNRGLVTLAVTLVALVGTLVAAGSAVAANETAVISSNLTPHGAVHQTVPKPATWSFQSEVSPGIGEPTILPTKKFTFDLPEGMELRPDESITPACPDSTLANWSSPPSALLSQCPNSVVGSGTGSIYFAQSVATEFTDPVLLLLNAEPAEDGSPRLAIFAWSESVSYGVTFMGVARNGELVFETPVLVSDSSIGKIDFEIPGDGGAGRPELSLTAADLAGDDPGFVRVACPAGTWETAAEYDLGTRQLGTGVPTSPTTTISAPPVSQPCAGDPDPVRQLEVNTVGSGTVTSLPAGIDCGVTCEAGFTEETEVTLTAAAAPGSTFTGWTGACSGIVPTCQVTLSSDLAVTATFTVDPPINHTLTVTRSGNGQGTVTSAPAGIACGSDCSEAYTAGTGVTLTAVADPGSTFAGWSGACSGASVCQVTMDGARQVSAAFAIESLATPLPPPEVGRTVNLQPVKGAVTTKCPGDKRFSRLVEPEQVRMGCQIDARKGTVRLTSAKGKKGTQSARFWAGVFRVGQRRGNPEMTLALVGPMQCGKSKKRSLGAGASSGGAAVSRRKKGGRKLWGSGKGRYKTKGKKGSASVRGTDWLVEDRCDGTTFFRVKKGVVSVRDFARKKTIRLKARKTYVAGKARRR